MIVRTKAICLQIRPWSKTSQIVTWLTPEFGKVVTVVKGACRPKSAFLGQYDLFYTCELLFYRREKGGMHAIRECTPLCLREALRTDWRATETAAYLADLTVRVTVGPQEAGELYSLFETSLDLLAGGKVGDLHSLLLWYEIHLLHPVGLMPDMQICPRCRDEEQRWFRFALASGHFICAHDASRSLTSGEATVQLHRDVRTLFLQFVHAPVPPLFSQGEKEINENSRLGLSRFLGIFFHFHLDVPPAVRRVTLEMVSTKEFS